MTRTIIFSGYLAELARLQAERKDQTPEDYILSFFARGAMHPTSQASHRRGADFSVARGAMHHAKKSALAGAPRAK